MAERRLLVGDELAKAHARIAQLEAILKARERIAESTRKATLRDMKAALAGDTKGLWLRVALMESGPLEIRHGEAT